MRKQEQDLDKKLADALCEYTDRLNTNNAPPIENFLRKYNEEAVLRLKPLLETAFFIKKETEGQLIQKSVKERIFKQIKSILEERREKTERIPILSKLYQKIKVLIRAGDDEPFYNIPVVGTSPAGQLTFAVQDITKYEKISKMDLRPAPDFFLKVRGDSMIGAGINDGNLIAVKQNVQPNPGDIVVYMVNNESTIKRFYRGKDCIILKAANDDYEDIIIKNTGDFSAIVGKVVGILKE